MSIVAFFLVKCKLVAIFSGISAYDDEGSFNSCWLVAKFDNKIPSMYDCNRVLTHIGVGYTCILCLHGMSISIDIRFFLFSTVDWLSYS